MLGKSLTLASAGNAGAESDPDFANTVLLLHGDGNQGATNFSNTGPTKYLAFSDNSDNNFPITVNGDAYGDNFSPYALDDGYWGNYFDGSSSTLQVPSNTAFNVGTGDFTLEFWINRINNNFGVFKLYSSSTSNGPQVDGSNYASWHKDGVGSILTSTTALFVGEFYHIAYCRSGTTFRLFVNGVQEASVTNSDSFNFSSWIIGRGYYGNVFNGYLSNFRLLKAVALYTSGFTPSTSPLTAISGTSLLTCQSNRFVDNSANNFALTPYVSAPKVTVFNPFDELPDGVNGSGYFDGSGDDVSFPIDSAFTLGSNEFTIEGWVYPNTVTSSNALFSLESSSYPAVLILCGTGTISFLVSSTRSSFQVNLTGFALRANTWSHIVLQRNGDVFRAFINGVVVGSETQAITLQSQRSVGYIGRDDGGSVRWNGYVASFRVVNGTAVYSTSGFTPPTAPLTAIANTELLTCQYAGTVRNVGFIDSGPYDFPITRYGNTTQGSFSPFSKPDGRWGNYFDPSGSAGWIFTPQSSAFTFDGDFTISTWAYLTSLNTTSDLIGTTNNRAFIGSGNSGWTVNILTSGNLRFGFMSSNSWVFDSNLGITVPLNQFVHIAVVRSGSTITGYVNGVAGSSPITSSATLTSNLYGVYIGNGAGSSGNNTHGYVSNAHIQKGVAINYASVGVPTSPESTTAYTSLLTCQSNRYKDNSTNSFTITTGGGSTNVKVTPFSPFPITTEYSPAVNGGSGSFDGTGDYLTAPTDTGYDFTGDFAIELWIYPLKSTYQEIIGTGTSSVFMGSGIGGWNIQIYNSTTALSFAAQNSNSFYVNSHLETNAALMKANSWNHVVVSRVGSTIRGFINGVVGNTTITYSGTVVSNQYLSIGSGWNGNSVAQAYIAGVKITDGTGVASVTVPTAPPTTTNTPTILCNFTNAGIFDNTGFNVLESVGNSQINTTTKKYGTGSLSFDGTGDYLKAAFGNNFDFGTGPFTVEFWLYLNATTNQCFLDLRTGSPFLFDYSSNALRYFANSTVITGSALSTGQWYHIALTRDSSSNNRMFVDGTQTGSTVSNSTNLTGTTIAYIGANYVGGDALNGYIDDLRITKGVARYTTTFTPPDKAFPNVGV
jgi:hypothetical protein